MRIVVCVKQVPDTWTEKRLAAADSTLDRAAADGVINELDEYAIEESLRIKESQPTQEGAAGASTVTVLSMGPQPAESSIRKALTMGVDSAVHLVDDALHGSDALQTSYALAQVLGTLEWDLVVFGSESTDARMSVVPAMVAERLGLPQLSFARKVEVADGTIRIERQTEDGYDVVEGRLPAILSVVEKINEPRYPSFKGIMAAKKKPLTTLTCADAGIDPARVGLATASSVVTEFTEAPPWGVGTIVKGGADGGVRLAEFLAESKFL